MRRCRCVLVLPALALAFTLAFTLRSRSAVADDVAPVPALYQPPPPTDVSFVLGGGVAYAPTNAGGPAVGEVQATVTSTTLRIAWFDLRTAMPWLPIAAANDQQYGKTQACYFCAALDVRVAHLGRSAVLALGADYDWVYVGAGGFDDHKQPVAGLETRVIAQRGRLHGFASVALQGVFVNGYGGNRRELDVGGWIGLGHDLAVYGRLGLASGHVDATKDAAGFDFGGPIVQLGLAWTI